MLAAIGINAWLLMTLASGAVGWASMWVLGRWAARNGRTHLAMRIDDMMTGHSSREAHLRLKEAARLAAG